MGIVAEPTPSLCGGPIGVPRQKKELEGRLVFCPQKSPQAYSRERERHPTDTEEKAFPDNAPRKEKKGKLEQKKVHQNRPHFFLFFGRLVAGNSGHVPWASIKRGMAPGCSSASARPMPRLCHKTPSASSFLTYGQRTLAKEKKERVPACLPFPT